MKIEMPRLALIVDDDEGDLIKGVIKRAKDKFRITLKHCTNLEAAKDVFEKSGGERTFVGIILDFQGKVTRLQEIPDKKFMLEAKAYFDLKAPNIPIMFMTAYHGDMRALAENVYSKDIDDVDRMLAVLKKHSDSHQFSLIKSNFSEIFEVFEMGLLKAEIESLLLDCLVELPITNSKSNVKKHAITSRAIIENLFREVAVRSPGLIPEHLLNPDVKCKDIVNYLTYDKKILHKHNILDKSVKYVYGVASDISHDAYDPSQYTMQALWYGLFDAILWYKQFTAKYAKEGNSI